MARKINITDKLNFDDNPILVIRDQEIEVNADAATVLQIMDKLDNEVGPKQILEMFKLIFPEESQQIISNFKFQFDDFQQVVMSAISLITGDDDDQGEVQTHTMT